MDKAKGPRKTTHLPNPAISIWEQQGDTLTKIGEIDPTFLTMVHSLVADAAARTEARGHPEPVRVLEINDSDLAKWQRPPFFVQPVHKGRVFPSAIAASNALGYTNNEVGQKLAKAKGRMQKEGKNTNVRLRPAVTLRGVTLQYERDFPR